MAADGRRLKKKKKNFMIQPRFSVRSIRRSRDLSFAQLVLAEELEEGLRRCRLDHRRHVEIEGGEEVDVPRQGPVEEPDVHALPHLFERLPYG